MEPMEALAMPLDCGLSVEKYDRVKKYTDATGVSVLPNRNVLLQAKKDIVDPKILKEKCTLTPSEMSLPMEFVSIETLEAICQCEEVKKKLLKLSPDHSKKIMATFHAKYGSDGAQSEAQYQGYKDKEKVDDKNFHVSEWVALFLEAETEDGEKEIIWFNCECNSASACRPLR